MERRLHAVESPLAPSTWPSIASASAELRRPRLYAVREARVTPSPVRMPADERALRTRRR